LGLSVKVIKEAISKTGTGDPLSTSSENHPSRPRLTHKQIVRATKKQAG